MDRCAFSLGVEGDAAGALTGGDVDFPRFLTPVSVSQPGCHCFSRQFGVRLECACISLHKDFSVFEEGAVCLNC